MHPGKGNQDQQLKGGRHRHHRQHHLRAQARGTTRIEWPSPRTFNASAMAAMGQPLLGDGVLRAWRARVEKGRPLATTANNKAVMRAGTHDSTSSARAAHLPAHCQYRPPRMPG